MAEVMFCHAPGAGLKSLVASPAASWSNSSGRKEVPCFKKKKKKMSDYSKTSMLGGSPSSPHEEATVCHPAQAIDMSMEKALITPASTTNRLRW